MVMVGLESFHIEEEERSAVIPVVKSFGSLLLANETKIGTKLIRCIFRRHQRHFCMITGDFVNQNEALFRVDGRLASRPPCGVFWVVLTYLQTVILMAEHTVSFVEHKVRSRAHTL